MANDFDVGSLLGRWIFAVALVFGTYNPTSYSYVSWLLAETTEFGPIPALVGIVLLLAWIVYVRASLLSLGVFGLSLFAALFGCVVWLLVDLGWLSLDSTGAVTWVVLLILSLVLAVGISWSHVRRRLTGQVSVDDVED